MLTLIVIVGSGILGLSLAAFFSKNHDVCVVDANHPFQGSKAAAANIATKAQLFGRDPHFALKIQAKAEYECWLSQFFDTKDFAEHFRRAPALDIFESSAQCEVQLKRILQPESDLRARGLRSNPVTRLDSVTLQYDDEIWVDARVLCQRIKDFCSNVCFVNNKVTNLAFFSDHLIGVNRVILACGAWTSEILTQLNFSSPAAMRISAGSVVSLPIAHEFGLLERNKIVVSGGACRKYYSSTVMKSEFVVDDPKLLDQWAEMHRLFVIKAGLDRDARLESNAGWRMGYGHSEIKIERLGERNGICFDLCAGAHRSGFAFAPMVGKLLQNLQG